MCESKRIEIVLVRKLDDDDDDDNVDDDEDDANDVASINSRMYVKVELARNWCNFATKVATGGFATTSLRFRSLLLCGCQRNKREGKEGEEREVEVEVSSRW